MLVLVTISPITLKPVLQDLLLYAKIKSFQVGDTAVNHRAIDHKMWQSFSDEAPWMVGDLQC